MRRILGLVSSTLLAACSQSPEPANPALWHVEGSGGQQAWLFGTIHSVKRPLAWDTAKVRGALAAADSVMVEVSNLADEKAVAATFARLAKSSGQPVLSQRISVKYRPALAALLKRGGYTDGDFALMDTWAAALTLARIGASDDDSRNGVDRAVMAQAGEKPVVELEGAERQLGLFDGLAEADQRDLLTAVVTDQQGDDDSRLAESWRKGDMTAIERETRRGMLTDPQLRAVLFTGRNRDWTSRIAAAMTQGHRPFVAVGAAHMAGPEGLPALLAANGYKVTRVE
ncbi:TraB/GumN family protein [Sphingomonas sp. IC081]|uniref:TraB/GumN family protein n=1 Tax=Sphingomonas sp. IC081 TaxID=304378 RepID=UPI00115BFC97|nr:TraB/GumN family protein [Sphingomonas sp. IC081]QDK32472.1 TraB/GumN family protein [Sphingomonas sp. IC081]